MRNTFIVPILLFLMIGCNTKSKKQDSIEKTKLEIEQQLIQDSIYKADENIVISDIEFGISESEYNIKSKIFIEALKDSGSNYPKLGKLNFELLPRFTEDSLYSLAFRFWSPHGFNKSNITLINEEYTALVNILKIKYSEPDIHDIFNHVRLDLKDFDTVLERSEKDKLNLCSIKYDPNKESVRYYSYDIWHIGNKNIEIRLYFSYGINLDDWTVDYNWRSLYLTIYQRNIYNRFQKEILEKEKIKEQEKRRIEEEKKKKEKEDIEKAIKVL